MSLDCGYRVVALAFFRGVHLVDLFELASVDKAQFVWVLAGQALAILDLFERCPFRGVWMFWFDDGDTCALALWKTDAPFATISCANGGGVFYWHYGSMC